MTHQNDYTFADGMAEKGCEATLNPMRVLNNNAIWKIFLCCQSNELFNNDGYFCP